MRVLLINPRHSPNLYSFSEVGAVTGRPAWMPNLALPTLAALAPPEVEVTLVDEAVAPVDFRGRWDLVGITGYVSQRRRMIELAEDFRRRGQRVAIGGPYASLSPQRVRPHADILFLGEAEETWPRCLADLRAGRPQAEYRAAGPADLAASPLPEMRQVRAADYTLGTVQTSRGCPFQCEFCDVIVYLGRRQRHKGPAQVVAELEQLYGGGFRGVFLSDDNFTANRRQAAALLEAIAAWNGSKPEPVELHTQLSIDIARDQDRALLDLAVAAGLKHVFIGIESPDPAALQEVKKRQNLRADLLADLHRLAARGIIPQLGIITGFDADTPASFRAQYEFIQESGAPSVLINLLQAPDGTPLQERLARAGRLTPGFLEGALGSNIVPLRMSSRDLLDGTLWLLNRVNAPEAFLERMRTLARVQSARGVRNAEFGVRNGRRPGDARPVCWDRLRQAFAALGPEFRDLPGEVERLFPAALGDLATSLILYLNVVAVLQRWGVWDPELARRAEPAFGLGPGDYSPEGKARKEAA